MDLNGIYKNQKTSNPGKRAMIPTGISIARNS